MSRSPRVQSSQHPSWMPATAGTLSIIAGSMEVLIGLVYVGAGADIAERIGRTGLGIVGVPFVIAGIVAIIGGVFAAVRKAWWMALVGAVAGATWPVVWLGWVSLFTNRTVRPGLLALMLILALAALAATVLTAMARREFK